MDSFAREDESRVYGASPLVERRKLNWSAIFAGVVATLGLQVLMLYFGGAMGLSLFNPFEMALNNDSSYVLPILWLAITALASSFFGAWVAGHWANLYEAEDAYMHGALTWALCALVLAAGLGTAFQMGTSATQAGAQSIQAAAQTGADTQAGKNQAMAYGTAVKYDPVMDPNFSQHLISRAQAWNQRAPASSDKSMEASYEHKELAASQRVDPKDIKNDTNLRDFISLKTGMSKDRAEEFLEAEKDSLAQTLANTKTQFDQRHAEQQIQAEKVRQAASTVAWTWTGLALLALAASLGGSYLGWRQRYRDLDDDDVVTRSDEGTTRTDNM
jgi:hypothetical protein